LLKSIVDDQGVDDPSFFKLDRAASDTIEVEDGSLGSLLIGLQETCCQLFAAFESPRSSKTLEAIDEYRLSIELTDDNRRQLTIVSKRLEHLLLELRLREPIPIQSLIELIDGN
jgi:hypothetical protein